MSSSENQTEYASLLSAALPAVIHNEAENERYIGLLQELDRKGNG